jgi:tetratricopeptide (TPR) repeat protein
MDAFARDLPALTIEIGRLYLAEFPDDPIALTITGQSYSAVARYEEARAVYERALTTSAPERRARVLSLIGDLHQAKAEIAAAESAYRGAIQESPDDASAFIYLGGMLATLGRLDEAEAILRRATSCAEGCLDEVYLNLGFVLRAQGEYLGALDMFREALRIDPTDQAAQDAILDMDSVLFQFPEA